MNRPEFKNKEALKASDFCEITNYLTFLLYSNGMPSNTTIKKIDIQLSFDGKDCKIDVTFFNTNFSNRSTALYQFQGVERGEKLMSFMENFFQGAFPTLTAIEKNRPDAII